MDERSNISLEEAVISASKTSKGKDVLLSVARYGLTVVVLGTVIGLANGALSKNEQPAPIPTKTAPVPTDVEPILLMADQNLNKTWDYLEKSDNPELKKLPANISPYVQYVKHGEATKILSSVGIKSTGEPAILISILEFGKEPFGEEKTIEAAKSINRSYQELQLAQKDPRRFRDDTAYQQVIREQAQQIADRAFDASLKK